MCYKLQRLFRSCAPLVSSPIRILLQQSSLNSAFSLLPPELTERILSFLPATSLLACCQVRNVKDLPFENVNMQVSRLWKDQVGSLKGLWLAQARRIGCQTGQTHQKRALAMPDQAKKTDWASVPDEWSVESRDITSGASELGDTSPEEAVGSSNNSVVNREWKTECVAGLKLRHLLDAGKAWTHEELVNLVKSPGRCLCHQSQS